MLGSPIWTVGRIVEVKLSSADGKVREVNIEYKNSTEKVWRTIHRAARSVAVLHREEDLDIMQGLNKAARAAERAFMMREIYVDQQEAVARELRHCKDCKEPILCVRHSAYFSAKPYVYPAENL